MHALANLGATCSQTCTPTSAFIDWWRDPSCELSPPQAGRTMSRAETITSKFTKSVTVTEEISEVFAFVTGVRPEVGHKARALYQTSGRVNISVRRHYPPRARSMQALRVAASGRLCFWFAWLYL